MKAKIDVKDKHEAAAIMRAMEKPDVRAMVVCIGVLETLPNDAARQRVLQYVSDLLVQKEPAGGDEHQGGGA